MAADVTTDEGTATLATELPEVDVLVNNLGIFGAQEALTITDDDWRRYFEVNVLTAARLIRTYLPGMRDRGWGRIQNIASDSAVVIPAEMIHYGVSKTALLALSRGFAKEAAGSGVRDPLSSRLNSMKTLFQNSRYRSPSPPMTSSGPVPASGPRS